MLPAQFPKALRNISSGKASESLPAKTAQDASSSERPRKGLSTREKSILQSLLDGAPNKVIAQNLSITEATVKLHVKAILNQRQEPYTGRNMGSKISVSRSARSE